ncbi:unnamed protein product [marine sediment metagenome]|uniref:Uncharacterized protein n=1 Tax=marine sediment metagenome TaxID=412755 RepID=X1GVN0_9ZZZZ
MGIERVTVSPTHLAVKAKAKMKANIVKSIDDGKWERGLLRVDVAEWKEKAINKGLPRISIGIDEAAGKVEAFASDFLPFLDKVATKVDAMPDVTLEDSIARMTTQIREVAKFKRS